MHGYETDDHSGFSKAAPYSIFDSFTIGTGQSIYKTSILPAILNAKHEVILATCFWAPSHTADELAATLTQLSRKQSKTNKVRVYICLSSRSIPQKLFHTSSPAGHSYSSSEWVRQLSLPPAEDLPGLEMSCKSLYFRPFSVLHSKYAIIDRSRVFFPSCNVSWEDWYECCVSLQGPIVQEVFDFWRRTWEPMKSAEALKADSEVATDGSVSNAQLLRTELLPHPYNSSLREALWFLPGAEGQESWKPLNRRILGLIINARSEVILLTPNFTSKPAFLAVCHALCRGVSVRIITNRRMMVPEQLVTAGVLTEQYVKKLVKEYKRNFRGRKLNKSLRSFFASLPAELVNASILTTVTDSEGVAKEDSRPLGAGELGKLQISYFISQAATAESSKGIAARADKSHVKLTLIDKKVIVLGSGNMDRASWTTSQELGVLIEDPSDRSSSTQIVGSMWKRVESGLEGCLEEYFSSVY